MNTRDLECFEVVYAEKSIHKAAAKLFITPQGLGKIIRNLETEFSSALFRRTKQGVVPTEAGQLLHTHADQITGMMHRLTEEMQQASNRGKLFRVGFANGVLRALPLGYLFVFMDEHPQFRVEWAEYSNDEILQKLENHELEYGFMVGDTRAEEINEWKLRSLPLVLLAYRGHPLYEEESVTLDQLRDVPLLIMNEQFRMFHDFQRACKVRGFVPNIIARTTDGGTLTQMCAQGAGLAVLPDFGGGFPENVKPIPFQESSTWDVYAIYMKDTENFQTVKEFDIYMKTVRSLLNGSAI